MPLFASPLPVEPVAARRTLHLGKPRTTFRVQLLGLRRSIGLSLGFRRFLRIGLLLRFSFGLFLLFLLLFFQLLLLLLLGQLLLLQLVGLLLLLLLQLFLLGRRGFCAASCAA